MIKLAEILEREKSILVDTSIKSENNDFFREIYDAKNFSELNRDALKNEISFYQKFMELLTNPKVCTIDSITDEIGTIKKMLSNKITSLAPGYVHFKKKQTIIKNRNERKRELIVNLQDITYNLWRISKQKQLKIKDENYALLLDMVKLIERRVHLKKDCAYENGFCHHDKSHESDTDERIVAALYYNKLFSVNDTCLLSCDTDFLYLLGICTKFIGSKDLLPHNSEFRDALYKNPIRLYTKSHGGDFDLRYFRPDVDENFEIRNLTKSEDLEMKKEIISMMSKVQHNIEGYH